MSNYGTENVLTEITQSIRLRNVVLGVKKLPTLVSGIILLRWVDFCEAEQEAVAAFNDEEYSPVLPEAYHWRRWHSLPANELKEFFFKELPEGIMHIQDRQNTLAMILKRVRESIAEHELEEELLEDLVNWLARQRFETPSDRQKLLFAFDDMLKNPKPTHAGEFLTPKTIGDLMVALVSPSEGDRLYDPCFGLGGLLTSAWEYRRQTEANRFQQNGQTDLSIEGVDINRDVYLVAMARLVLAGATEARLETGNSLERDFVNDAGKSGYDVVLSSPPWGMRVERDGLGLGHFPVKTRDGTGLFLQHILGQLKPGGRAAVVVPWGFLFQRGDQLKVRQWILEHHHLDAVIALPDGAFLPYSSVKAAILVLRRNGGGTKNVRMIDSAAFFEKAKAKTPAFISPEGLSKLLEAIKSEKSDAAAWDYEVETIRKLEYNLTPVRRDLDALETALEPLKKAVPVQLLKSLCKITMGVPVKSDMLNEEPAGEKSIPYLRIGDLQSGLATKGKSWIMDGSEFKKRLRAGQVLVSRSGTIGKVGVVRNGGVGGLASQGFLVLTPDQNKIDPHFLAAYLQTEPCSKWLGARSTGSTIQSLRREILETIPVPVPPLQIQQRVVSELEESTLDLLDVLGIVLNESKYNPAIRWIAASLNKISASKGSPDADPVDVVRNWIFGPSFKEVIKWSEQSKERFTYENRMEPFLDVFNLLEGSKGVPEGPAFISILHQVITILRQMTLGKKDQSLVERRINELALGCADLLSHAAKTIVENVSVSITQQTEILMPAFGQEISFKVKNFGALPISNFIVKSAELNFESKSVFLPEKSENEFTFEIQVPEDLKQPNMAFGWEGYNLAGQKVQGASELIFQISEGRIPEVEVNDLGRNPYFHGPPVGPDRNDVFFGRDQLLSQIRNQVQSGNTVLLEGNRRSGKSSILRHLEGKESITGWIAVFADFQSAEGDKTKAGMASESVWRALAAAIIKGLMPLRMAIPLPNGTDLKPGSLLGYREACRQGISTEAPWEDFLEFFQSVLRCLQEKDLGLVLMIDEFDKLQEGIDNGVTSPQIPENIRYLIQNHSRFVAILTGARRMQRLRHEYWSALFGLGNRIDVSALDPESAQKLVTEPVKGRIRYTGESVEWILHLTARQPFLIQYLCNRLFELAAYQDTRSISRVMVEEAASGLVRDNEHFASQWDYAETDRRRLLLLLCHQLNQGPDPVTFVVLRDRLVQVGIQIRDADLEADLKSLRELELIDYSGAKAGSTYSLTVPLMGQWLDEQQEFAPILEKAIQEQENAS